MANVKSSKVELKSSFCWYLLAVFAQQTTCVTTLSVLICKISRLDIFITSQTSLFVKLASTGDLTSHQLQHMKNRRNGKGSPSYCWWFRNPVNSPVEVGSFCRIIHIQGFIHPRWFLARFLNHQQYHSLNRFVLNVSFFRNARTSPWSCTLLCYRFTGFSLSWNERSMFYWGTEPLAICNRNKPVFPHGMVLLTNHYVHLIAKSIWKIWSVVASVSDKHNISYPQLGICICIRWRLPMLGFLAQSKRPRVHPSRDGALSR